MKKHIIMSGIPEFAGSNVALMNLVTYLGKQNVVFLLDSHSSLENFRLLDQTGSIETIVIPNLHRIATFRKRQIVFNVKEFLLIMRSVLAILFVSIRYGCTNITISCTRPEWYLYVLWIPLIKIHYILHSEPLHDDNSFTALTCNFQLSKRKNISTVSNANRSAILKMWNINSNKTKYVLVIYNCLLENTGPIEDFKEPKKVNTILTMGHVVDYKNPFLWLEVARQITSIREDVEFVWLGNGQLLEYFQLNTSKVPGIKFLGKVDNPAQYLNNAAIYYQPSKSETQGIAVLEAMASGVPCVVSNAGGLPESIVHRKSGLVVDYNCVETNVQAILELLNDSTLQHKFVAEALERYNRLFKYNSFKAGMDNVYVS